MGAGGNTNDLAAAHNFEQLESDIQPEGEDKC